MREQRKSVVAALEQGPNFVPYTALIAPVERSRMLATYAVPEAVSAQHPRRADVYSVGLLMGRPGEQTFPIWTQCDATRPMAVLPELWRGGGWLGYVARRGHSNITTGGTSMKVASQGVELNSFRRPLLAAVSSVSELPPLLLASSARQSPSLLWARPS
jgi:hypothetical protein